jgi:hypothetical protein
MSEHGVQPARSRLLIKAYLLTWALLALGGLGYLATLAWPTNLFVPTASPPPQIAESEQALRTATRALTEIGAVRRTVSEVQKDVGQVKDAIEQRAEQDKSTQTRLTALEEQISTLAVQASTPAPAPKEKAQQKAATEKARPKTAEPRAQIRAVAVGPQSPPNTQIANTQVAQAAIETGSVVPSEGIGFGEAVVTPSSTRFYAVQLASGPSPEALRLSWDLLVERNGTSLQGLQPRFVKPRRQGGAYRLVAGPLPNKLEAERICGELQTGRSSCASTEFIGDPL